MEVLVTGGAGYIGSHLVDRLVEAGHEVSVLDDLSSGRRGNIDAALATGSARLIEGSILDEELVGKLAGESELVFHLAAAVGVSMIVDDPLKALNVNTRGTEAVLGACFRHGVKVLLASTSEIYGKTGKVPFCEEDDRVLGPTTVHRWGYSTSKAFDEHLALAYADQGLRVSIVRYFNSYGPRLDPQGYGSVVANFMRQALAGEPLTVHGDGRQTRCFTYIDDTVSGTLAAGTNPAAEGRVYNLGTTDEIEILALAKKIRDLVESNSEIELTPYEAYYGPGFEDTRRRLPNIERARDELGWMANVSLDTGLEQTLDWWRETHG